MLIAIILIIHLAYMNLSGQNERNILWLIFMNIDKGKHIYATILIYTSKLRLWQLPVLSTGIHPQR